MYTLKKLLYLLTVHERKRMILLLAMILIMALLDTIGVASIMPFIIVLTKPELVETNIILNKIFQVSGLLGVDNNEEFLVFLGILVFVLLVTSLAFKALTIYAQTYFIQMREYSISKRLMESYISQPFSWFLSRHSADLGKSILSEVQTVIGQGLKPMMNMISYSVVSIMLIALLVLTDPKITLIIGFILGAAYGLIYTFIRSFLKRIGQERLKKNKLRFTAISEAFGAIKEIKVGGLEKFYISRFSKPAQIFAQHQSTVQILGQLPRYALEAVAFGGLLLMILFLFIQKGNFIDILPMIVFYTFAGYRLMPALQQIYLSVTQLRFVGPSLEALSKDLKILRPFYLEQDRDVLMINKGITLNHIHFNYPNTPHATLKDIYLKIPSCSTVGLVGSTGSGKTTTVDIILGLLEAQKGTLEVDGKLIDQNNIRAWQRSIGYVPQNIYLTDDTVAANIAFGNLNEEINLEAVERAAKIADLHEFVINELPLKYQTTIGERGVRLSGGQRQRIGIARALYHNPKLLILDEATNALDTLTEQAVMDSIHKLKNKITIIMIAHRLSTIKECNIIFLLKKGELKAQGTFNELVNNCSEFDKLINSNKIT